MSHTEFSLVSVYIFFFLFKTMKVLDSASDNADDAPKRLTPASNACWRAQTAARARLARFERNYAKMLSLMRSSSSGNLELALSHFTDGFVPLAAHIGGGAVRVRSVLGYYDCNRCRRPFGDTTFRFVATNVQWPLGLHAHVARHRAALPRDVAAFLTSAAADAALHVPLEVWSSPQARTAIARLVQMANDVHIQDGMRGLAFHA